MNLKIFIISLFLIGCSPDEMEISVIQQHLKYVSPDTSDLISLQKDASNLTKTCQVYSGLYYVVGLTTVGPCTMPDLASDSYFRTIWIVNRNLPCNAELKKTYHVDTLNFITGEECPTTIVDKIYTNANQAFIMDRKVSVNCGEGLCSFSILFFAWDSMYQVEE